MRLSRHRQSGAKAGIRERLRRGRRSLRQCRGFLRGRHWALCCHGGTGSLSAKLRGRLSRLDRRRVSRWESRRRHHFLCGSRENVFYYSRGRFVLNDRPASSR